MSKQIICIKASSHSDFELYLMSEKYDIPYEFLIEYKKDKSIYKFWTELGTGIVSAIEEIIGNERIFSPTTAMSERDKQLLIAIQPLKAGQAIRKYKGDIDEKEKEFKIMSEEIEKKKQQLLNRNYDPSNIVCINSKSTPEQIFAVCLNNDIDFSYVMYFIKNNSTIDINRVWFEKKTNELVAYNYLYSNYFGEPCERFEVNMSCLIPKKAINRMSMAAVKTPKIKVTKKSLEAYQKANDSGYYINIPKFERMLESGFLERLEEEHVEKESSQIDLDVFDIEELKSLMQTAVEDEDYESAASLRDAIKEIENKKKK
jgi:hypothetical protein